MLRFVDVRQRREHNINWGMFDFEAPNFALNFYLGRLRYFAVDDTLARMVHRYREWEKRPVWLDHLDLTPTQKLALFQRAKEGMKAENRYFWYQYFFKNCATIPRDHLDAVLGGVLKERFTQEYVAMTFRDYVRENLRRPPPISWLLDIAMNDRLDHKLSKWEEMFYPPKLREHLMDEPARDDALNPLAGRSLLVKGTKLVDLPDVPQDDWNMGLAFLLVGLALCGLRWILAQRPAARAIAGGLLALWGLWAAFLGMVMAVSWGFSAHEDLWHNANLWLFWPLDVVFMAWGWRLIRGRGLPRWASHYLCAHAACLLIWAAGWALGLIAQNISWVLVYQGPVALGIGGILYHELRTGQTTQAADA